MTEDNKTRLRGLLGKLHWVFAILWHSTFQLWANVNKIPVKLLTDISFLSVHFIHVP